MDVDAAVMLMAVFGRAKPAHDGGAARLRYAIVARLNWLDTKVYKY
jgi:hypothetical protein